LIDSTAPTLARAMTPAGAITLHQTGVTAVPHATDASSGVPTQSCGAIATSAAGDHTVTCHATDNAGHLRGAVLHYTVGYRDDHDHQAEATTIGK